MNSSFGFTVKYFKFHLTPDNVVLAQGYDAVVIFVNDTIDAEMIMKLKEYGVKLIALRSAGFNNVIITSHQGFFTREAIRNIAETTLKNIDDFFAGRKLDNEVCYNCPN